MKRRLATLVLLTVSTPIMAQWLTLPTPGVPRTADGSPDLAAPPPRTTDGRPDLSGLWTPSDATGDLFDSSKVQQWARDRMAESERRFFGDDPRFLCLPSGPGTLTSGGLIAGIRRIVQSPTLIAILRADLTYRQIFMDGRDLEEDPLPIWMGYSVGHWDGDTLVVESNGFNDRTWLHRGGLPHTEALRMTERYTRSNFGSMQLDVTYDDPGTFESPLHASVELRYVADDAMLETVCNEAEVDLSQWEGNFSEAEENVVEVAPEILERYVGTYRGYWLQRDITVEVTLEDGALFLERTPPYQEAGIGGVEKTELVALSDTAFESISGLGFIFTAEEGEMATEVAEVHVSGAWPFPRVD